MTSVCGGDILTLKSIDKNVSQNGKQLCDVQSSWSCSTEKCLDNIVIFKEDTGEIEDPISLISVDTCVWLTRGCKTENQADSVQDNDCCSITLQTSGNIVISKVSILSEARLIEVYGPCEEYLNTVRAEFVVEVEDINVHHADITLRHPSNIIILKMNRLSRENDMWIFGLVLCWKDVSSLKSSRLQSCLQNSAFNFDAVNRRLSDVGQGLSVNAQQCKRFLEMFNSNSKDVKDDNRELKPLLTSLLASTFQGSSNEKEAMQRQEPNLELMLDQKLTVLENRILSAMDQRLQEFEKKQCKMIADGFEKIMLQLELGPNCKNNQSNEKKIHSDIQNNQSSVSEEYPLYPNQ